MDVKVNGKNDITGKKFGRLTAIAAVSEKLRTDTVWELLCDCGNNHHARCNDLMLGKTTSCGCRKKEGLRTRHGMATHLNRSRFYVIWKNMKIRCNNPKSDHFKSYGARGITVCDRCGKFDNFYSDMYSSYKYHSVIHGELNTTIDRINNDAGYTKENCRWATKKEQARNKRISSVGRKSKWN